MGAAVSVLLALIATIDFLSITAASILQRIRFLSIFNTFGRSIMVIFGQAFFRFCKIGVPYRSTPKDDFHFHEMAQVSKVIFSNLNKRPLCGFRVLFFCDE